jgi:hypothetical protein
VSDPRPVREILDLQQEQISRLRAEIDEVKARLHMLERQLGWDPDTLEFPAGGERA